MKIPEWDKQIYYHNNVVKRVRKLMEMSEEELNNEVLDEKGKKNREIDKHRMEFVYAMEKLMIVEKAIMDKRRNLRKNHKGNPNSVVIYDETYKKLLKHVFRIKWNTDRLHYVLRITELTNKRLKQVISDANQQIHHKKHKKTGLYEGRETDEI